MTAKKIPKPQMPSATKILEMLLSQSLNLASINQRLSGANAELLKLNVRLDERDELLERQVKELVLRFLEAQQEHIKGLSLIERVLNVRCAKQDEQLERLIRLVQTLAEQMEKLAKRVAIPTLHAEESQDDWVSVGPGAERDAYFAGHITGCSIHSHGGGSEDIVRLEPNSLAAWRNNRKRNFT